MPSRVLLCSQDPPQLCLPAPWVCTEIQALMPIPSPNGQPQECGYTHAKQEGTALIGYELYMQSFLAVVHMQVLEEAKHRTEEKKTSFLEFYSTAMIAPAIQRMDLCTVTIT